MRDNAARQRGFTLLEVLIAFAIAALAVGALVQGAAAGIRNTRESALYAEALSRARSHLAAEERTSPLVPGDQAGDDGSGFRWRTRIVPLEIAPLTGEGTADANPGPRVILYTVAVTIEWQGGQVSLATERVAPAPTASQ
jgi:general secretion pathway protein I